MILKRLISKQIFNYRDYDYDSTDKVILIFAGVFLFHEIVKIC